MSLLTGAWPSRLLAAVLVWTELKYSTARKTSSLFHTSFVSRVIQVSVGNDTLNPAVQPHTQRRVGSTFAQVQDHCHGAVLGCCLCVATTMLMSVPWMRGLGPPDLPML